LDEEEAEESELALELWVRDVVEVSSASSALSAEDTELEVGEEG
jgi:hypothetical protein